MRVLVFFCLLLQVACVHTDQKPIACEMPAQRGPGGQGGPGFYGLDEEPLAISDDGRRFVATKEVLGQGGYKTVYLGYEVESGEKVAFAIAPVKDVLRKAFFQKECQHIRAFSGLPHCAKYEMTAWGHMKDNDTIVEAVCFIQKYYPLGTLLDIEKRRPLTQKERFNLALDAVAAISELHQLGFSHRDIKPESFLVAEENGTLEALLFDFGTVVRVSDRAAMHRVGAALYMAPDLITAYERVDFDLLKKCLQPGDIYGLAQTFWWLFYNEPSPQYAFLHRLREAAPKDFFHGLSQIGFVYSGAPVRKDFIALEQESEPLQDPLKHLLWQMGRLNHYQRPKVADITQHLLLLQKNA